MTISKPRPNRQNIYLPDHLRDIVSGYESLSGRIATIIDRYHEALRRTRIEKQFTADELDHIARACVAWLAEPAATIFDGVAMELEDEGVAPQHLIDHVRGLSPFEQVALVEWMERQRDREMRRMGWSLKSRSLNGWSGSAIAVTDAGTSGETTMHPCTQCDGTGFNENDEPCPMCDGTGEDEIMTERM